MPSTIKIRVIRAMALPIMDTASQKTDAYVQIKFGNFEPQTTTICYKTLNPVWNQDFRIEVHDDIVLQDNLVQFKVFDKDTYSADDSIGVVLCDLSPLLLPEGSNKIAGWFPIYDTLHGIRGRLLVIIKLQFFGDVNPFKDSAAGISIYGVSYPQRFCVHGIHGFVEELLASDDPEYSWSDFFQTSKTSNESRQLLLYQLSSKIHRNVGRKALEVGGNAVLGFNIAFDLESSSGGLVVRGFGTACTVHKISISPTSREVLPTRSVTPLLVSAPSFINAITEKASLDKEIVESVSEQKEVCVENREEETAELQDDKPDEKPERQKRWFSEVPFLTLVSFPSDVYMRIAGVVSARSVKHLGTRKVDQATRDSWWLELRDEIKGHANTLNCSSVLGYQETATIFEDICVLSAYGTAANCGRLRTCGDVTVDPVANRNVTAKSYENPASNFENLDSHNLDSPNLDEIPVYNPKFFNVVNPKRKLLRKRRVASCSACHIPYTREKAPFRMNLVTCEVCKKRLVPEMILATIEPPPSLPISGIGQLIEARVCRTKKVSQGEHNAIIISEAIPFIEYDLHRQLIYKLRVMGMNAAFRLSWNLSVGTNLIIGTATATAVYLPALPAPPVLKISRNIAVKDAEDANLFELQRKIMDISEENHGYSKESLEEWKLKVKGREQKNKKSNVLGVPILGGPNSGAALSNKLSPVIPSSSKINRATTINSYSARSLSSSSSESESSESDALSETDPSKLTFVLQIDDDADEDILVSILDPKSPLEVFLCNTELPPGLQCSMSSIQMISCLRRVQWAENIASHRLNQQFAAAFHDLYASMSYKAKSYTPCCISGLRMLLSIPAPNTIELMCTAHVSMLDDESDFVNFASKYEKMYNSLAPFLLPASLANPFIKNGVNCLEAAEPENEAENLFAPSFPPSRNISSDDVILDVLKLQNTNSYSVKSGSSPTNVSARLPSIFSNRLSSVASTESVKINELDEKNPSYEDTSFVEITPLSTIMHATVDSYLGRVQIHLIKESWSYKEEGGLGQFAHVFISEAQAISRAHVVARGGNALLGYRLHECRFIEPSKNQAYSVISLSGDAVHVTRHNNRGLMGIYLQNKIAST